MPFSASLGVNAGLCVGTLTEPRFRNSRKAYGNPVNRLWATGTHGRTIGKLEAGLIWLGIVAWAEAALGQFWMVLATLSLEDVVSSVGQQ